MSGATDIEWTDATWNPVVGCTKVSPGCQHCYAERIHNRRYAAWRTGRYPTAPAQYRQPFEAVQVIATRLTDPLHWKRPRRVFVNSMSDLFHAQVPTEFLAAVFAVMAHTPQHVYQILTKRTGRMLRVLCDPEFHDQVASEARRIGDWLAAAGLSTELVPETWPLPNVWLGVSVETQDYDWRIEALCETPAAVRFASCEPLLGPLDLRSWLGPDGLGWVIVGGESGPGFRPCDPAWIHDLRNQCQAAGVPLFVKQDSGPLPGRQGRIPDEVWSVKEFPDAR